MRPLPNSLVAFGELGLAGEIRPVPFGEERLREAAKHGFKPALVPEANVPKRPPRGHDGARREAPERRRSKPCSAQGDAGPRTAASVPPRAAALRRCPLWFAASAACNGVTPRSSAALGSASCASSASTLADRSRSTASIKALRPCASRASMSARGLKQHPTRSRLPDSAACRSAVPGSGLIRPAALPSAADGAPRPRSRRPRPRRRDRAARPPRARNQPDRSCRVAAARRGILRRAGLDLAEAGADALGGAARLRNVRGRLRSRAIGRCRAVAGSRRRRRRRRRARERRALRLWRRRAGRARRRGRRRGGVRNLGVTSRPASAAAARLPNVAARQRDSLAAGRLKSMRSHADRRRVRRRAVAHGEAPAAHASPGRLESGRDARRYKASRSSGP